MTLRVIDNKYGRLS